MNCPHPQEERQRVYEGGEEPRDDRSWCGLCGELLYEPPALESARHETARTRRARRLVSFEHPRWGNLL